MGPRIARAIGVAMAVAMGVAMARANGVALALPPPPHHYPLRGLRS